MHIRDLIVDWRTDRLEYRKLALNTCALLQAFTWTRMALDYPVHKALEDPMMWIVFYMVIAGHDLLARFIKLRSEVLYGTNTDKTN